MEKKSIDDMLDAFDLAELYDFLVNMNQSLSNFSKDESKSSEFGSYLEQLTKIISKFEDKNTNKSKGKESDIKENKISKVRGSANLYRLISRNLIMVFSLMQNKIFDFVNNLTNQLVLNEENELSEMSKLAIIILIDIFEAYPNSLNSIVGYCIGQIYKIIKKEPRVSSNLVYLLYSMTKNATKLDIDDKLQSKLLKVITKNITQYSISFEIDVYSGISDNSPETSILIKKNYILVLKNLLVLSITANYENLLAVSTSGTSAGSKLKPATIMSQQHQFQSNLLSLHVKTFQYGLSNFNQEIRVAMVDLLANLFINFVPTGKFNTIEYLIGLYPLPNINNWNDNLTNRRSSEVDTISHDGKKEKSSSSLHDGEFMINSNTTMALFQAGVIETIILFIQLEQFQNSDYIPTQLTMVLDQILGKFGILNRIENHIFNHSWNRVMKNWESVINYLISEGGISCHEILMNYVYLKLNLNSESEKKNDEDQKAKGKKRESIIFNFKTSKSLKTKESGSKEILPFSNSYQAFLLLNIVKQLLPYGLDFNSVAHAEQEKSLSITETQSAGESNYEAYDGHIDNSFLKDTLFTLLINRNDYIRNYALEVLLQFSSQAKVETNQLMIRTFKLFSQAYENVDSEPSSNNAIARTTSNISGSLNVRLMSYALFLLSSIKRTDAKLLQNTIIVKILSFCTQHLKHNTSMSSNSTKNSACWIVLSSLVTLYNDSEFVKLNSSQFLVFWKGLLTSQYTGTWQNSESDESIKEVIENLKVRNFSLICLLNYLNSVNLTPESLKQIQFLLSKSYNYLTYLESNLDEVGTVTNFNYQKNSDLDYNLLLINNLQFSGYSFNGALSADRVLVNLVLYGKKVILQGFAKIATLSKIDINSNMVIFLLKVFGDTKVLSRYGNAIIPSEDKDKQKSKSQASKLNDININNMLLHDDENYSYGITSKYRAESVNIDELFNKSPLHITNTPTHKPLSSAGSPQSHIAESRFSAWFYEFESMALRAVDNSINYDPSILLLERYSIVEDYSPNLLISLIDTSIELFQIVFPQLSLKIQFALLEQMRNSISLERADPLRRKAVLTNLSITIHGLLSNIIKKNYILEKDIVDVLLDILTKIKLKDDNLIRINSHSIGIIASLQSPQALSESIAVMINGIVSNLNPYERSRLVLSLGQIYQNTHIGFKDIYSVVFQLLSDPNPILYHYCLESALLLFEDNLEHISLIPVTLEKVYANYLDNSFGCDSPNNILVNLSSDYGSIGMLAKLLKLFTTSLGPNIRTISSGDRANFKNIIIPLGLSIGSSTIDEQLQIYKSLLELFAELIIYDSNLIENEIEVFTDLIYLVVSKNLKIGIVSPNPTSMNKDDIFPFNTSYDLYKFSYKCLAEAVKVFGIKIITKDMARLMWISMNIKPCSELVDVIKLWLDSSPDSCWFTTLSSLFKYSTKKLVGNFIDLNFLQKLLPLQQRQKKKNMNNVELKDEEIENIVSEGANDEKDEPLSWEFKVLIFELMIDLLDASLKDEALFEYLKSKINDIVKMSFLGSTATILDVRLRGIALLDKTLELFGNFSDPLYPGISILEQQQAPIISALVPCFSAYSDITLMVDSIKVASKFINLLKIKFHSKKRILKSLISLLEEISANKFITFGYLENVSEYNRKAIQLSILNCWALLKLDALENPDSTEPELLEILNKYSVLLTSLWILVLREFSVLKYNASNVREIEIYSDYWINFISILSSDLEKDEHFVDQYLAGDATNFYFILFSQCVESLMKNNNVSKILVCLNRLVQSPKLVELLFYDDIFGELIGMFDRFILLHDDELEICMLIEIVANIFNSYLRNNSNVPDTVFDKLFELVRICMLPLFNILPFLRSDFDCEDQSVKISLKECDSTRNILVLKKSMQKIVDLMSQFPQVVKNDLYSCLLFVFTKIYEFGNEKIILTLVLPYLKQIIQEVKNVNTDLVEIFGDTIRDYCTLDTAKLYGVLTFVILTTNGDYTLKSDDAKKIGSCLIGMVMDSDTATLSIQCIKSLIQSSNFTESRSLILRYLMTEITDYLSNSEISSGVDLKVAFEILLLYVKLFSQNESKFKSILSFFIPLLLKYTQDGLISKSYAHDKLIQLVHLDPSSFKYIVNGVLSPSQRAVAEDMVKIKNDLHNLELTDEPKILLKSFNTA